MSEVTGRCGCGCYKWAADQYGQLKWWEAEADEPGYPIRVEAEAGTRFCLFCGHQLLADGRTLPPATEQERRDAKAMDAIRNSVLDVNNYQELVGMDAVCTGAPKHPWVVTAAYITKPEGGAMEWQADDPVDAIEECVKWLDANVGGDGA